MPEKSNHLALLFKEIEQGDTNAFDTFFSLYYHKLLSFALHYTKQLESAEEITSELFVKLWFKREGLSNVLNPEVYLFIAIKNACLNLMRSNRKKDTMFSTQSNDQPVERITNSYEIGIEDKELIKILNIAVAALPEQRQIIFKLIKEDGLKGHEVALILGISTRTVENQLYKAVKVLADSISDYLGYHPQKKFSRKQAQTDLPLIFFL